MNPTDYLVSVVTALIERRRNEDGYTTETIVVTALLVALAITVLGIVAAKVISKGNGLSF